MLTILKVGGSAITDKQTEFNPNIKNIYRISREISDYLLKNKDDNLLIVHGGGSYSHIVADRYDLKNCIDSRKNIGVSLTSWAAKKLNDLVIESLIDYGISAYSLQPSACIFMDNGIEEIFRHPIENLLMNKFVPVMYGDIILSNGPKMYEIESGERIIFILSKLLKPDRVIIGTNVDGVYVEDPRTNASAKIINNINKDNLQSILNQLKKANINHDVTGGMYHKVELSFKIAELGITSKIIGIHREENLYKILMGEEIEHTEVVCCEK